MRTWRRDLLVASVALAAHAVAFASLGAVRPGSRPLVETPAAVEIEIDEVPAAAVVVPPVPLAREPSEAPASTSRPPSAGVVAMASSAEAAPTSSSPAPARSGEPAPFTLGPPPLSADALGLGGRNVFLGKLPDAPSAPSGASAPDGTSNVAPGAQQSMRDALREHDHSVGLDVGGPLVGATEAVVRSSDTPVDSRAVFEITADASGRITRVRLLDASDARGGWERVASSLAGALRSQHLELRGHAGAIVTLAVDSRWVLPSGNKPGHPIGPTTAVDPQTGGGCQTRGSGCSTSTSFDVTDLATKGARQVHARVLSERFP